MKTFNKDINGLRAIAVISVLLFHFSVPGFSGGFVGVDVFFVISGFLMTKIIFSKLDDNRFSIIGFYMERARRIVPALAVLCLTLLIAGWIALNPGDFMMLGKHVAGSLAFVSNIMYWQEAGYFDVSSHEKLLLHTWSLSVEWQFYILYPILVLTLARFTSIKWTKITLILIALASLGASVFITKFWPSASFYLITSRAWEMLAGGLLYLYPIKLPKPVRIYFQTTGIALIVFSVFYFSGNSPWPGWLAAIPVIGTLLVILSSTDKSIFLGNMLFQWAGKVSYSVYLWHWPIVVYLNYQNRSAEPLWVIAGGMLSLLLGGLSYQLVENPARKIKLHGNLAQSGSFWAAALIVFLISGFGIYTFLNKGIAQRFPIMQMTQADLNEEWSLYAEKYSEKYDYKNLQPEERSGTTLIVGSSHARDLANAFIQNGYESMTSFRSSVCANFSNAPNLSPKKECEKLNQTLMDEIEKTSYSRIYLHDHWPQLDTVNLEDFLMKIRSRTDAPIYIFGPKMTYKKSPLRIIHDGISSGITTSQELNSFARPFQGSSKRPHIRNARAPINQGLVKFFKEDYWREKQVFFIDVIGIQCGENVSCEIISGQGLNLKPLYFDDNHWSLRGAREFGEKLKAKYPNLFRA